MRGRGRRGHTSAFDRRWAYPESARDDYARVISDRKWPLKKTPVIAHIKARSKHSFLTINRNDKITQVVYPLSIKKNKNINNLIHGDLGALVDIIFTWARRMGQSNRFERMIHALELKLLLFKLPMFVLHLQCLPIKKLRVREAR